MNLKHFLLKFCAIAIPFVCFINRGNYRAALICLILQLTLVGWIPASVLAFLTMEDETTKQKMEAYLEKIDRYSQQKYSY